MLFSYCCLKDTQAKSAEVCVCVCVIHGWDSHRLFSILISDSAHRLIFL